MIHLCTCTGGSASTINSSRRRGGTVSCKNCGGKVFDGKSSSSSCLLSTVLELTSLINSDFTWTKVSKGCRSSSRRPRRSNTIDLASEELLTKDSKGLEMPVSESEKLGVTLLGCHFSEKAEHIPIKKRRFLFRASSPPRSAPNLPSGGSERNSMSLQASSHGLQLNPTASCLPTTSEVVARMCQRGSNVNKVDEKNLVMTSEEACEDEDFSGISILAAAACSNSLGVEADLCEGSGIVSSDIKSPKALTTVEFKENNVKSANICTEESDSHTSIAPYKGGVSSTKNDSSLDKFTLDNSSLDESTLDNSSSQAPLESAVSKSNQEESMIQKSSARDVRLNWDLNTVMDAWEEPFGSEHELSASDAAHDNVISVEVKKNDCMKGSSGDCEHGSASKNISNLILPLDLKSLANENELKLGECKPDGYAESSEPLSPGFDSAPHAVVDGTESLHNKYIYNANDAIPVARNLTLENPTGDIFAKWVDLSGKSSGDLGCTEAVDTELSMDRSVPPGFDHCLNLCASEDNVGVSSTVAAGNNVNFPATITQTVAAVTSRTEDEKHDLSLATAAPLENGAHQSGVTSNKDDDEARLKIVLTNKGAAMEDFVSKGTGLPQETGKGGSIAENQSAFGAVLVRLPSGAAEFDHKPAAFSSMHDAARSDTEAPLDNGFGYDNSQCDNRAGSGIDKLDEFSVGYDSQYEDGELRDSNMHTWKGYEGEHGENEFDIDNRGANFDLVIADAHETSSRCEQEGSSRIKPTDIESGRDTDLLSSVLLPDKLHSSDEVSGSGPTEVITGQGNNKRQDAVKHASQSDEWKMNVSGWDLLPENHRSSSNNCTKTRNFSSRKFSYREQKDGFEAEDMEIKAEGSRFYRKESFTRIGGPSTRDVFLSRGRFRMQGCSSRDADDLTSRPERETGVLRSFGRGGYSPHSCTSGQGGGMWNRSPERGMDLKRLPSPSYQGPSFLRSMIEDVGSVDDMTHEGNMDQSDAGRPNASSYVTRPSFRSRSPTNREENDFRARLGSRPTGDTSHDRFVNVGRGRGRGRPVRYGSRLNGGVLRERYHGPASDDCDELLAEYSHPFPRRRRCFSPIDRRGSHSYSHHRSDSRSPARPRTRSPIANGVFRRRSSRSPNFRPDARMRRPRSPNYRRGFEADHVSEYNSGPRNHMSPPSSSRWVNYKERSAVFDRRSPPRGRTDPPQGERFGFYDSSRKSKQNEYYRSGHPGRFSDLNEVGRGRPRYVGGDDDDRPNHGYRRGGFVRRYNMDGHAKRFQYEEESFGQGYDSREKHALEFHARGNPKPYSSGTDSRFRDFPRRLREDPGDFKRRSREAKDPSVNEREPKEESEHIMDDSQRRPREVKDQSTNLDSTPKEVVKEGDEPKLGPN